MSSGRFFPLPDDKGMVAANLEVVLLLKRLNVPLDRDVIFLSEASEEMFFASRYGNHY
jgi:acetylornithine deacetylase/succinyl-diaminopimelate desuccinylase-like protein